jgi:signal transduction histidine kinase
MAIYYSRIFDAGMALETEVRRRRETAEELRKAIAEADRAGSAKAEFLARMSHEIKTPLNAIIGYSQLMREEGLGNDPAAQQDVIRIHDAGLYLVRLINMILDLSKLEAGRMQFNVERHSLRQVLTTVIDDHRAAMAVNQNTLVMDIDVELGEVDIDAGRLQQVVGAVLENAAEHTHNGLVTLIARRAVGTDNTFNIRIADTGKGIEPETLKTLFDAFQTTRDAASGRFGGTGTNLTVVHRLCRAMGGSIHAESLVGTGSTFTVTLPVLHQPADRPRLAA